MKNFRKFLVQKSGLARFHRRISRNSSWKQKICSWGAYDPQIRRYRSNSSLKSEFYVKILSGDTALEKKLTKLIFLRFSIFLGLAMAKSTFIRNPYEILYGPDFCKKWSSGNYVWNSLRRLIICFWVFEPGEFVLDS